MIREALAEKSVGEHTGIRWRGGEVTRLEGFADAVLAFAMTLLVVSLEVPQTFDELLATMRNFLAFGLSFAFLMYIWYQHYIYFRRYGLHDTPTVVLNALLLFVVLFYVYPLKFLTTFLVSQVLGWSTDIVGPDGEAEPAIREDQLGALMVIYGMGYIAVFGVLAIFYYRALRNRKLDLDAQERFVTVNVLSQNLLQVAIGALSVIFALVGPSGWAGWTYLLIAPAMTLHGILRGRRSRQLFGT